MGLADRQDAGHGALHADRRLRHPRRLDLHAGRRGQPRQHELVDPGRVVAGAHVHLLGAVIVDDVDDELAGRFDVTQRVLLAALARRAGERDGGRLGGDRHEVAEGRQIGHAGAVEARYPGDWARHDRADQELVYRRRVDGLRIDVHGVLRRPQGAVEVYRTSPSTGLIPRASSRSRRSMVTGKISWIQSPPCVSYACCSASTAIRSSANTDSVKWRKTGQITVSRKAIRGFFTSRMPKLLLRRSWRSAGT